MFAPTCVQALCLACPKGYPKGFSSTCGEPNRLCFERDKGQAYGRIVPRQRTASPLRIWFILAVATLYISAQGVEVVRTGKRRWVDTHWFRGNSYFLRA